MAASGWKIAQVVRPHVKMIAFRHGAGAAVGAAAADIAAATATPTATSTVTPGNVSSQSTPVTQIHHDSDVPPRYRRLPMSEEEIAYITRGGPE